MSRRVFFAVRWQNGALTPMLFHDEFNPTKEERATMYYACELPPSWCQMQLPALAVAYNLHAAAGTLPPSALRRK
jgi:hypothetical protein